MDEKSGNQILASTGKQQRTKADTGAAAPGGDGGAPNTAAGPRFALPAECVVQQAQDLREQLLLLVEESAPVTIDVAELQRIDTSGAQILAAFVHDRRQQRRAVLWSGHNETLGRACDLLGMRSLLDLPV